MTTTTAAPCALCRTSAGAIYDETGRAIRKRGLCAMCYERERLAGRLDRWAQVEHPVPLAHVCPTCAVVFYDAAYRVRKFCSWACANRTRHATFPLPAVVTPAMLGISPGQPPTDPGLTPATVWAIAHVNAERATCWLVNKGGLSPDEAAALAYLSYAAPVERAAA